MFNINLTPKPSNVPANGLVGDPIGIKLPNPISLTVDDTTITLPANVFPC